MMPFDVTGHFIWSLMLTTATEEDSGYCIVALTIELNCVIAQNLIPSQVLRIKLM